MYVEGQIMPNCNTMHMPTKIVVPIHTWITEDHPSDDDAIPVMQTGNRNERTPETQTIYPRFYHTQKKDSLQMKAKMRMMVYTDMTRGDGRTEV